MISSRLALNAAAAAMVVPDDEAGVLFASALAVPGADMWPLGAMDCLG